LLNLDAEIDDTVLENLNRVPIMHELENEITMEKLDEALTSMSNEKSAGFDAFLLKSTKT
jgi:hypothetical protein